MKISYLITVHNETDTLIKLLERLINNKFDEDEMVVLDDFSDNAETKKILTQASEKISIFQHALNNDYGSHKNFGNSKCLGDWIFQIDADELPSETLIFNIRDIISTNLNVELIYVSRINDFKGVTDAHAKQWGWKLTPSPSCSNRPIVNWPDYQSRIYKRIPDRIKWDRRLHETITGHNEYAFLPKEEDLALYHDKTIEKQIETNLKYNKLFTYEENIGHTIGDSKPRILTFYWNVNDLKEYGTLPKIGDILNNHSSWKRLWEMYFKQDFMKENDVFKVVEIIDLRTISEEQIKNIQMKYNININKNMTHLLRVTQNK
jgi:glycosyltransferase involved in cell wall biosynthesis